MAELSEVQEFLASDPMSRNPYASIVAVDNACMVLGLDPVTGIPLPIQASGLMAARTAPQELQARR
jgi:hypothetical protein